MKRTIRYFCLFLALWLGAFPLRPTVNATSTEIRPPELKLNCKSAVLIEVTTGKVLYESNPNERLPIASVTKIMTLLLAMEALSQGKIHLDEAVPISENAAGMGGSQVFLEPGERISLHEVLKAVFVSSANDGAVALAELISGSVEGFVAAMNEKASALGMHDTVFYNPTGLDDNETGLSTAHDVALMSKALLSYPAVYDYTTIWIDSIRNGAFGLSNTNKLIRFYPGATGLKTGSTAKAKYCVSASAQRNGLKLCAVVLAGETSSDRFQAAKALLDYGFANYAYYEPGEISLPQLPVWGGKAPVVPLSTKAGGILLSKGDAVGLEPRLVISDSVKAPVEKGQTVGKIQYHKNGQVVYEAPIYTAEAVGQLKWKDVFLFMLRSFFTGTPEASSPRTET